MVFSKIISKKFIDVAGQKNVDRWIQEFLGSKSIVFAPVFPIDLSKTIIAGFPIDKVMLKSFIFFSPLTKFLIGSKGENCLME